VAANKYRRACCANRSIQTSRAVIYSVHFRDREAQVSFASNGANSSEDEGIAEEAAEGEESVLVERSVRFIQIKEMWSF
jgi:hypothetical protein